MIVNGRIVDFDVCDPDERRELTSAVTAHMLRQPAFAGDRVAAALAAAYAVDCLQAELVEAAAYRYLRDEIIKTMADPDSWDGEASEEGLLVDYVQHLAGASHGNCRECGRRIGAAERFEPLQTRPQQVVICQECA